MWLQIRTRFTDQEDEIARYRTRLEETTEKNTELGRMVDDLLATIEGNLNRARDQTIPRITNLAEELLASEPQSAADGVPDDDTAGEISFQQTLMASSNLDHDMDAAAPGPEAGQPAADAEPEDDAEPAVNSVPDPEIVRSVLDQIAADDHGATSAEELDPAQAEEPGPVQGESLSDGIRDIISRVENMSAGVLSSPAGGAGGQDSGSDEFLAEFLGTADGKGAAAAPTDEPDDALAQELREIESLRNELSGLRDRLTPTG
jgi:hypothetical protein